MNRKPIPRCSCQGHIELVAIVHLPKKYQPEPVLERLPRIAWRLRPNFDCRTFPLFCKDCAKESCQPYPSSWQSGHHSAISLSSLLAPQSAELSMHCAKVLHQRGRMHHAAHAACGRHPQGHTFNSDYYILHHNDAT